MSKYFDRKRKRSRSSKQHREYSSKEEDKSYEKQKVDESYSRKRDKKYDDKTKGDDFKMPSKCSIGSNADKPKKDIQYSYYLSSKYENSCKSSSINNYSCAKTNKSKDEEHYVFEPGEVLIDRYEIIKHLADGTFGRVYDVCSLKSGEQYACKIIRAVPRYIKSAKIEAKILCDIKDKAQKVVRVKNFFHFKKANKISEQYCLIFEKLGMSLYQFLEENDYRGYHLRVIQQITIQVLQCLRDLKENCKLIHTDLKPENILLVNDRSCLLDKIEYLPLQVNDANKKISWRMRKDETISYSYSSRESEKLQKNPYKIPYCCLDLYNSPALAVTSVESISQITFLDVKIIDFGSATYETENCTGIINTRQYRGPEVMLECCSWNDKSDIWSLACILVELYTGNQLFPTHETIEHLDMIDKLCGPYPSWMKNEAVSDIRRELTKIPNYGRRAREIEKKYERKGFKQLRDIILPEHREFRKFIEFLLEIDPRKRPSAREALNHRFLNMEIPIEFEEYKRSFESKSTKHSSSAPKDCS